MEIIVENLSYKEMMEYFKNEKNKLQRNDVVNFFKEIGLKDYSLKTSKDKKGFWFRINIKKKSRYKQLSAFISREQTIEYFKKKYFYF